MDKKLIISILIVAMFTTCAFAVIGGYECDGTEVLNERPTAIKQQTQTADFEEDSGEAAEQLTGEGGTANWDKTNKVLTLTSINVNFDCTSGGMGIRLPANSTIVLVGNNYYSMTTNDTTMYLSCLLGEKLTIRGGYLDLYYKNNSGSLCKAINANSSNITFDSTKVNITCEGSGVGSALNYGSNIKILNGSDVTIKDIGGCGEGLILSNGDEFNLEVNNSKLRCYTHCDKSILRSTYSATFNPNFNGLPAKGSTIMDDAYPEGDFDITEMDTYKSITVGVVPPVPEKDDSTTLIVSSIIFVVLLLIAVLTIIDYGRH